MEKETKAYPSSLTDDEWAIIFAQLNKDCPIALPREWTWRELFDGLFYVLKTGCQWRQIPKELPPWQTIYRYFHRLKLCQFWQNFNAELNGTWRTKLGRQAQPTAASLDSQSIKASETGSFHDYDAGKKIRGTKRHLLVDTLGLIMVVVVHSAGVQDFHGAKLVFARAKQLPVAKRLKVIWADGIYERECVETALAESGLNCRLEIIKRSDDQKVSSCCQNAGRSNGLLVGYNINAV